MGITQYEWALTDELENTTAWTLLLLLAADGGSGGGSAGGGANCAATSMPDSPGAWATVMWFCGGAGRLARSRFAHALWTC